MQVVAEGKASFLEQFLVERFSLVLGPGIRAGMQGCPDDAEGSRSTQSKRCVPSSRPSRTPLDHFNIVAFLEGNLSFFGISLQYVGREGENPSLPLQR